MRFRLLIDPDKPEEVVATVHARSGLTDQLEELVLAHSGADRIAAYEENALVLLPISDIACIRVLNGKTYAVDKNNRTFRLKLRLYELEQQLPGYFVRINKSALANERQLERFAVTYSGAVDAVFKCGFREYVSRRCFSQLRRRFEGT